MAIPIIPESVWKNIANPMEFSNLDNPMGTGSLKFKEITPQSVTFSSNGNHPDSPQYLEGIVFNLVQDETMGFLGLIRGDYDYIYWDLDPSLAHRCSRILTATKTLLAVTNHNQSPTMKLPNYLPKNTNPLVVLTVHNHLYLCLHRFNGEGRFQL